MKKFLMVVLTLIAAAVLMAVGYDYVSHQVSYRITIKRFFPVKFKPLRNISLKRLQNSGLLISAQFK